jgi:hypothetical protein
MTNNLEAMVIERSQWRKKAQAKLDELDLKRENSEFLGELPLDNLIAFAYLMEESKAFSKIENSLTPGDFDNLEHLPILTMAWILAMEDEGLEINIDTHKQGSISQDENPYLYSVYLTIKLPDGQNLGVSPIDPWHERFADLGDQILTKKGTL